MKYRSGIVREIYVTQNFSSPLHYESAEMVETK